MTVFKSVTTLASQEFCQPGWVFNIPPVIPTRISKKEMDFNMFTQRLQCSEIHWR